MPDLSPEMLTQLVDTVTKIAPWAGGTLAVSICFRVMGEKPSSLIQALAALLWGRGIKRD